MDLMINASIFYQVRISHVATVHTNVPREDIQTPNGSSEAVVASVESIAMINLKSVELYGGPRTIGCSARCNGCKCYGICFGTCGKKKNT